MTSTTGPAITQSFKNLLADIGPIKEVNADSEFERPLQAFLGSRNIAFRIKQNVNDLALLDANMGNFKKALAKDLQQHGVSNWPARLPKVVKRIQQERP